MRNSIQFLDSSVSFNLHLFLYIVQEKKIQIKLLQLAINKVYTNTFYVINNLNMFSVFFCHSLPSFLVFFLFCLFLPLSSPSPAPAPALTLALSFFLVCFIFLKMLTNYDAFLFILPQNNFPDLLTYSSLHSFYRTLFLLCSIYPHLRLKEIFKIH